MIATNVCVDATSDAGATFSVGMRRSIIAITLEHLSGGSTWSTSTDQDNFGPNNWISLVVSDDIYYGTSNTAKTILTFSDLNIASPQDETFKLYFADSEYSDNSGAPCYNVYATIGTQTIHNKCVFFLGGGR